MRGGRNSLCKHYCWKCQQDFNNMIDQVNHDCPEDKNKENDDEG